MKYAISNIIIIPQKVSPDKNIPSFSMKSKKE